jgi:hypothetical protein
MSTVNTSIIRTGVNYSDTNLSTAAVNRLLAKQPENRGSITGKGNEQQEITLHHFNAGIMYYEPSLWFNVNPHSPQPPPKKEDRWKIYERHPKSEN